MTETWNYLPGETVEVRCYTNAGVPDLYINGRKVGDECRLDCDDLGFWAWNVVFEEGVVEAKAGDVSFRLETVGAPAKVMPFSSKLISQGSALAMWVSRPRAGFSKSFSVFFPSFII